MLITISGPPGSGTSTAARRLAADHDLEHMSGGDLFRRMADERGVSLSTLNERAETDDAIDRDLDRRLHTTARDRDDLVLESRLAGWMAGEHADLRVWLDAPIEVRAERIADREEKPVGQAREETEARAKSERRRYEAYYGIDIRDRSIYDLVVNTARWSPQSVLGFVSGAVERYDAAADEGATPITSVNYDFDA